MKKTMKSAIKINEFLLAILIMVLWVIFGLINRDILTISNLYSITRASIVSATFALSCMIVMIGVGIDISFYAVGTLSMYATVNFLVNRGLFGVPLIAIFFGSIAIAVLLQLINYFFIDKLNIQTFILTIGSQSLYKGFLLSFVGTTYITTMPKGMKELSVKYLATTKNSTGIVSNLHFLVLMVIIMYVLIHLILTYTRFGRNVYAIGSDVTAARRAGINVSRTRLYVFIMAGIICGIGGMFQGTLNRAAVPADLVGQELMVIAAVVLGGGMSNKARGSAVGTGLGVILLSLIGNSLILMKIPSYYQQAFTGIIILVGLILQSSRGKDHAVG